MLRLKPPKPEELFPDPEETPTVEDLRSLRENPAFRLILTRLHRASYPLTESSSDDNWQLTKKVLKAQGVKDALEEIERVVNRSKGQQDD
jgi:hypothetical protein